MRNGCSSRHGLNGTSQRADPDSILTNTCLMISSKLAQLLLALTLLVINRVLADLAPLQECKKSGFCSLGLQPSHYIGPLQSNVDLKAALEALAFRKVRLAVGSVLGGGASHCVVPCHEL